MITIDGSVLVIDTMTLTARMERGYITSLVSKKTGMNMLTPFSVDQGSALELVFRGDDAVPVSGDAHAQCTAFQLTPTRVELRFNNWHADGLLVISEDEQTGDLMVDASAFSSRPGVRSCRYNVRGLRKDMDFIAPITQGIRMKLDDPLLVGRRAIWPQVWEAAMWISQGQDGGFWMHAEDSEYRFKLLKCGVGNDQFGLGMEAENYGPLEDKLSAGGLIWRFNVYEGDWHVPAARYRNWLWKAYDLKKEEARRPDWLQQLSLGISWCPTDPDILDALARRLDPKKVILHLPQWRQFGYDEDYPRFIASAKAREFIAKCHHMGFHVMPHCTSMEIDPSVDVMDKVGSFAIREVETGKRLGWSWVNQSASSGVPGSDWALVTNKANKVMVKIHTALPMWHSILRENIKSAVDDLNLEAVFIDVTLCTNNAVNGLVNGTPTTYGLLKELDYLRTMGLDGRPMYICGEGRNEICMQGLCVTQAHLMSREDPQAQLRTGACDLNTFMFGKLCRTIGYNALDGKTDASAIYMQANLDHGAMPTLTIRQADEINHPNAAVRRMLELAQS